MYVQLSQGLIKMTLPEMFANLAPGYLTKAQDIQRFPNERAEGLGVFS